MFQINYIASAAFLFLSYHFVDLNFLKYVNADELSAVDFTALCKFQPNSYNCAGDKKNSRGYYYDTKLEDCTTFNFGRCPHNLNQFSNKKDCKETCKEIGFKPITQNLSDNVICRLQPEFGYCHEYHPMWYYDVSFRTCRGFSYSGCGGNKNRFPTAQICTSVCAHLMEY